jgi:predicted RNA-binding Zn-ribbon protein involved in translation (DUF1610 family)
MADITYFKCPACGVDLNSREDQRRVDGDKVETICWSCDYEDVN